MANKLLLRDGNPLTLGDSGTTELMTDQGGGDCCCGDELDQCTGCCYDNYEKSGNNCCYSWSSAVNKDRSLQVVDYYMRERFLRWGTFGKYVDLTRELIQNGDSQTLTTVTGNCQLTVPVQHNLTDRVDPQFSCSTNTAAINQVFGPRKDIFICANGKALWFIGNTAQRILNTDDCLHPTFGRDLLMKTWDSSSTRYAPLSRCVNVPDEKNDCFEVYESYVAANGPLFKANTDAIEFSYSLRVQANAKPCFKSGGCSTCQ